MIAPRALCVICSRPRIAAFTAAYDHNKRPVQALNDRVCYLDETPEFTIK